MAALSRDDIIGKRILQVLQTPWEAVGENYFVSEGLVALDNGAVFSLWCKYDLFQQPQESITEQAIEAVDLSTVTTLPIDCLTFGDCRGDVICEVLISESWSPYSLIVLLSTNRVIAQVDFPWSSCPSLLDATPFLTTNDTLVFWDRTPIRV